MDDLERQIVLGQFDEIVGKFGMKRNLRSEKTKGSSSTFQESGRNWGRRARNGVNFWWKNEGMGSDKGRAQEQKIK